MNGNLYRIELLSKDNFDTWKLQVEALLVKNDALEYVTGVKSRPAEANEAQTWDNTDRKAKAELIFSISPSELKQVKGCNTSNEVWRKLHDIFQSKVPARKATLLKRLKISIVIIKNRVIIHDNSPKFCFRNHHETMDKNQK